MIRNLRVSKSCLKKSHLLVLPTIAGGSCPALCRYSNQSKVRSGNDSDLSGYEVLPTPFKDNPSKNELDLFLELVFNNMRDSGLDKLLPSLIDPAILNSSQAQLILKTQQVTKAKRTTPRASLPLFPKSLNSTTVNYYINELTKFEYSILPKPILELLLFFISQPELFQILNRTSLLRITEFMCKKYYFKEAFNLRNLIIRRRKDIQYDAEFYVYLMDYSKQGKVSNDFLMKYLSIFNYNNILLNHELLYEVYYFLDTESRKTLVRILKEKQIKFTGVFQEFLLPETISTSEELKQYINSNGGNLTLTPGLVQYQTELLLKEGRLIEAWNFILSLHLKIGLNQGLAVLFIDYMVNNGLAYDIPSFCVCFQNLTGTRVIHYGLTTLLQSILSDYKYKNPESQNIDLASHNLMLGIVTAFSIRNNSAIQTYDALIKAEGLDESFLYQKENLSPKVYVISNAIRRVMQSKQPSFLQEDKSFYNLTKIFYPTEDSPFESKLNDEIRTKVHNGNLNEAWKTLHSSICKNETKMDKFKATRFLAYLIRTHQFHFVFSFIALLENRFKIDLRKYAYFNMLTVLLCDFKYLSSGWFFLVKLLYHETKYNYLYWTKYQPVLDKLLYESDIPNKSNLRLYLKYPKFDNIDLKKLQLIKKTLCWDSGSDVQFDINKTSIDFQSCSTLVSNILTSLEMTKLLENDEIDEVFKEISESSRMIDHLTLIALSNYFIDKNQLYNIIALSNHVQYLEALSSEIPSSELNLEPRSSSSSVLSSDQSALKKEKTKRFIEEDQYEMILRSLINSDVQLTKDQKLLIPYFSVTQPNLKIWKDNRFLQRVNQILGKNSNGGSKWQIYIPDIVRLRNVISKVKFKFADDGLHFAKLNRNSDEFKLFYLNYKR